MARLAPETQKALAELVDNAMGAAWRAGKNGQEWTDVCWTMRKAVLDGVNDLVEAATELGGLELREVPRG